MSNTPFSELDHAQQIEIFKQRFATIMIDMGKNVQNDNEMLLLIGSLASSLIAKAQLRTWAELKGALSQEAHDGLLQSIQNQGNELATNGHNKAAYAAEILGVSLITKTMENDPHMVKGDKLLDDMIQNTVTFFNHQAANMPAPVIN